MAQLYSVSLYPTPIGPSCTPGLGVRTRQERESSSFTFNLRLGDTATSRLGKNRAVLKSALKLHTAFWLDNECGFSQLERCFNFQHADSQCNNFNSVNLRVLSPLVYNIYSVEKTWRDVKTRLVGEQLSTLACDHDFLKMQSQLSVASCI